MVVAAHFNRSFQIFGDHARRQCATIVQRDFDAVNSRSIQSLDRGKHAQVGKTFSTAETNTVTLLCGTSNDSELEFVQPSSER